MSERKGISFMRVPPRVPPVIAFRMVGELRLSPVYQSGTGGRQMPQDGGEKVLWAPCTEKLHTEFV
jgi:hypothetical protein